MPPAPMTPIKAVKAAWERIAPLQLADRSWDNVGIMIESPIPNTCHRQVLLTIDLTTAVCNEALALPSCSVVLSYHPPIFRGLKSMTLSDPIQASLLRLAAKGISVFSPHTSLDATPNGNNTFLIQPFVPLSTTGTSEVLIPGTKVEGFEGAGMGRRVDLKEGLKISEVVKMVKEHLGLKYVQLATLKPDEPVKSIAVCAGSGVSNILTCVRVWGDNSGASVFKGIEADLLLTGEMSHHEVLAAVAQGQTVILCNHTNTERQYLSKVLQPWLHKELSQEKTEGEGQDWEVLVSKTDEDPLKTV